MNDLQQIKTLIYKKLARRSYSSHELKAELLKQLVPQELIDNVMSEVISAGYINDNDYLESFIRVSQLKKLGPERIIQKLMHKGFKRETIASKLQLHDSKEERITRIKKLLETSYKTKDLTIFKEKQKVIASLIRKGFSFEDIKMFFAEFNEIG